MKFRHFLAVSAIVLSMAGLSAGDGRAEQKLCVNSSTGASRIIDVAKRCSKAETTVVIPGAANGETIVSSSYIVPNSPANYLSLVTADNGAQLIMFCSLDQTYWFAIDTAISAGDVNTFNAVSGKPFQAFHDLQYGGGGMDFADITERPWTGVFTYKRKKAMSRFEVTFSEINNRRDCLITLFSVGLGSATVVKRPPCGNPRAACVSAGTKDKTSAITP